MRQRHRSSAALTASFCVALLVSASTVAFGQGAPARPNIVLIMSDDAGYADFGFMNQFTGRQTEFKTPNLNQLAAQSVRFANAYVPSSICAITRAGMLTGRHPEAFGFGYNALPEDLPYEGFPVDQVTLMERVKQLGYTTGLVGKWHLGEQPQWRPEAQGVDSFFGMWEGSSNYYRNDASTIKIRRGETPVEWWSEPSFNNIPNDPTRGRYLTDAFGDEASKYVAEHAGGSEPFFLYAALNAPHSPYESKQQDVAQFTGTTLTGQRRNVAAMTLALDRAVGNVLARIDDPNGDGDQSDSIADNTMVIFLNDNGGPNADYSNAPLAGLKGTGWEGGIRTPMLIRGPGLTPGVFNQSVTALDLFPTVVAAAGAEMTTPTNGVDLTPFLTGETTGQPHESIVFRNRVNFAGIRKGDWKLVKPEATSTWKLFHLNPDGSGEDVDLSAQFPEIVAELAREYVDFDVTLDKARNSGPNKVQQNDVWVRKAGIFANANWRFSGGWVNNATGQTTTMVRDNSSPNMVLVFEPENNADYKSSNIMDRPSGVYYTLLDQGVQDPYGIGEVMLNEIRLQGTFSGAANRKATIDGRSLLFVKDLSGKAPGLRLDAMQTGGKTYTYNLDLGMILYNDLVIEGNGDAAFRIGGAMTNFYNPSGVTKRGSSTVTFGGNNTFTGKLIVEGGKVIVDGASAAVNGAQEIRVGAGANLTLQSGLISTPKLDVTQGTFQMLGGKLQARSVIGNLTHAAGSVVVGGGLGPSTISGNFQQTGGDLTAIVNATTIVPNSPAPPNPNVTLALVNGSASIAGKLVFQFDLATYFPVGSTLKVLEAAGGLQGTFAQLQLLGVPAGSQWTLGYTSNAVTLSRIANSFNSADFDANGIVDGGDFMIWQRSFGKFTSLGDANGDGLVNGADLGILKTQYGTAPSAGGSVSGVPEPGCGTLVAMAPLAVALARRMRRVAAKPSCCEL